MSDRLGGMLEDIRAFVAEREWERFHDPKNLAMCLASEAGELLSELRWVSGSVADDHCRSPEHRTAIAREVADVAISLLMFADRIELDLPGAVHEKLAELRQKYPAEAWRGR